VSEASRVLGIFAKAPFPGQVKTRLAEATSAAFAADLAEAFLLDVLERYRNIEARRLLVVTPDERAEWFATRATEYEVERQGEGDLGARLAAFFERHAGAGHVLVLGTDSPNLPIAWVQRAFSLLEEKDVVLGPALDGGYYLLAARAFFPGLFHLRGWGGPDVLAQTVARVGEARLRLGLLPPWYDVDTIEDCRFLWRHLQAQRSAGEDPLARRTEETLRQRFG
jgi:rSAM/selenodomain-associated transferase 1